MEDVCLGGLELLVLFHLGSISILVNDVCAHKLSETHSSVERAPNRFCSIGGSRGATMWG